MQVRKLLLLTSVSAVFVVAPGAAVAKQGGTDRPFKGSDSSTTTADLATLTGTDQGTGVFSHLGKTTTSLDFTITPTGPNTFIVSGQLTAVAANGDQLFATCTGTVTVPSLIPVVGETTDVTSVCTVTGGTGRFSDASGTLTITARQEVVSVVGTTVTLQTTSTTEGRISY